MRYPLRQFELSNGMQVLLERAPDFGTAGVAVVVGSGAADEAPGKAGLAHLTEHLAFAGGRADGGLLQKIGELGGQANAFTHWDDTTYFATDLTSTLDSLLEFCRGLVTDPVAGLDEKAFLQEQRIVTDEMRLHTESGTPSQALGWLTSAAFPKDHPYGHPIAGTRETIAALTIDDVRAFAAAHYRPGNSTLVVSAPIDLDDLQGTVERVLGEKLQRAHAAAARSRPQRPFSPAETPSRTFETREGDVPTPTLWIGWSVPAAHKSERLAPLVEEAFALKLMADLQSRDPDIAFVSADDLRGMDAGIFFVRVSLKEGSHPDATIHSVVTELEGSLGWLAAQGGSAEAMKRRVAANLSYGEEAMYRRTIDLAWSYHHMGMPTFLRDRNQAILSTPTSEVTSYAHQFLTEPRLHAVLVQPLNGVAKGGAEPMENKVSGKASPAVLDVPTDRAAPTPPVTAPGSAGHLFSNLKNVVMPNGLRVLILPRPASPFHTALLAFKGGYAEEDPSGVTDAASWARIGSRYYDEFSTAALSLNRRHIVTAGATVDILRGMGSDLGPTLEEIGHIAGYGTFWPPRQFTQMLEVLGREERAPGAAFERAMRRAFYGAHPLGHLSTVDDVSHIPPIKVQKWVDRTRRPDNGLLVVVGDVIPERTARDVEAAMGHWGEAGSARAVPPPAAPPLLNEIEPDAVGQVVVQHQPGSLQAKLDFRCLLPPTRPDGRVARDIFVRRFEKKMWNDLREELGASYTIHGRARTLPGGTSVFDFYADIAYARLPEALRRLRAYVRASADGSSGDGLDLASDPDVRSISQRWQVEITTTSDLADNLMQLWVVDWPLDTLNRMSDQLNATRPEAVRDIAEHCAKNWIVGLLGEEGRLRRAWAQSAEPAAR